MKQNLHHVVTSHQHWKGFQDEAAKIARAEAKHQEKREKNDAGRREHQRLLDAYNKEMERALLDGDEPTIKYPGEWVEPRSTRVAPAELFTTRKEELNQLTRSWARRKADELEDRVEVREAQLNVKAEEALAILEACIDEMAELRDTLGWIRACAGKPQPLGLNPSLANFLTARSEGFSLVSGIQERGATSLPFTLDGITVEV